jgi:hypothetical protein
MAINSRLLVCMASWESSIICQTHAKVSPYFQVLALFKSFRRRVHPTLLKQELQTIKCIRQHNIITIKLIKFVKLSTWWLLQTSGTHIQESWWFESIYNLQGKIWPTRHTLPMLSPRIAINHTYLMWSTHSSLLWSRQQICTDPLPQRRRAPDTIHSSMTVWSAGPYPASLPQQPMSQWGKDKLLLTTSYQAYRAHNINMRLVRSILARGGQPIGP